MLDVVRLDIETYQPDFLVDNLSSIIWTERYQEPGECELRSSLIEKTMANIPEGSLISLTDSTEVMIVESHSIEADGDNGHVLITKGRTAETILEHRVFTDAKYGKTVKMQKAYTIQDALLVFIWDCICNNTAKSVMTTAQYAISADDRVPGVVLTDSTLNVGTAKNRRLENVNAWDQMRFWLGAGKFGIRTIRPKLPAMTRRTAHVSAAGTLTKPFETTDGLIFDIYEGVDRTGQSTTGGNHVIFSDLADQITDPTYLFSSKDYKNVAVVISASGPLHGKEVIRPLTDPRSGYGGKVGPIGRPVGGGGFGTIAPGEPPPSGGSHPSPPSGWSRKVRIVDAGTKDDDDTTAEFLADLPDKGLDTLVAENERVTLLDGTISSKAPFKYKKDYNLGDKVTLMGKYNIIKEMQVQEYTRTRDKTGETGFPGLVLWV